MSRLLAIASGKGGVGKTFLAASLGHAMARRGRSVLLFDGDLGLANLDVQLGVAADSDLGAVVAGRLTLADAVVHHPATGMDLIVGRSGSGALAGLPAERLGMLCRSLVGLADRYEVTLVDLAAGLGRGCRQLAAAAGRVMVVTTDEPTALTDAYAFIKVVCAGRLPVQLVVNNVEDRRAGQQTHEVLAKACRRFLGLELPLLGLLRRDPRCADAIRAQMPFLSRFPTSALARDIEDLAGALLQEERQTPAMRA